MKQATSLALVALMWACTVGEEDSATVDAGPEADAASAVPCIDLTVECPAGTPDLGTAGGFALDSIPIEWTYCEEGDFSYVPLVYANVPADVVSLAVTVEQGSTPTGIALLSLAGDTLIDPQSDPSQGPLFHAALSGPASTVALPADADTYPDAGCLAVLPIAAGDVSGTTGELHAAVRRGGQAGEIDINVVVVDGAGIDQQDLIDALIRMDEIYSTAGALTLGEVEILTTSDVSAIVPPEGEVIDTLRSLPVGGPSSYLNIFLVKDFLTDDGGILFGFAGGVPGPIGVHETAASGVVLAIDSHRFDFDVGNPINTSLLGETLAHELGHQVGLRHTTEADGSLNDFLPDTPACSLADDIDGDGSLAAEECPDGPYMMFWTAFTNGDPQAAISSTQADVLRDSPVAR